MQNFKVNIFYISGHSEKRFDCIKENDLFDLRQKFISFEQIFIWSKDILFKPNKFYFIKTNIFFTSKKVFQTNYFFDSIKYFFWVE